MLVLSRKLGEAILIGDNIRIVVVDIDRGKIRLAIDAPNDIRIMREELVTGKPRGFDASERPDGTEVRPTEGD